MYLFYATIILWLNMASSTPNVTPKKLYLYLAIALHLIVLLGMLLITIRSFRTVRIDLKQRKNALLLVLGWASLLLLRLLIWYISPFDGPPSIFSFVDDLALIALFAALLTATVCGLPSLRRPFPAHKRSKCRPLLSAAGGMFSLPCMLICFAPAHAFSITEP